MTRAKSQSMDKSNTMIYKNKILRTEQRIIIPNTKEKKNYRTTEVSERKEDIFLQIIRVVKIKTKIDFTS